MSDSDATGLKAILQGGGKAIGTFVTLDSVLAAEAMANQGFDFVILDRQHGLLDDATTQAMLAALHPRDITALVRVPWNRPEHAMRALDHGADGVVAPMVNDALEARGLVNATRYPPEGHRSWGPIRAGMSDPIGYTNRANGSVLTVAMIETGGGLDHVKAIAETDGIDALYVGPNDLSFARGNWHPGMPSDAAFIDTLRRIATSATEAGKYSGLHCASPAMADAAFEWGYHFVTIGTDGGFLSAAAGSVLSEMGRG